MGFFDPPHTKIVGWSPAYFQAAAALCAPELEALMTQLEIPAAGRKLFRTAVIGELALHAATQSPEAWSASGLKQIELYTSNACKLMPAAYKGSIAPAAQALLDFIAAALDTDSPGKV